MSKEAIYDAQISPLIKTVIDLCKEHKIAALLNFAIPNDEDPDLEALTSLPDETVNVPPRHVEAVNALRPTGYSPMTMTTEHADGSKTVAAIL